MVNPGLSGGSPRGAASGDRSTSGARWFWVAMWVALGTGACLLAVDVLLPGLGQ